MKVQAVTTYLQIVYNMCLILSQFASISAEII